jgi:hypothetical protein
MTVRCWTLLVDDEPVGIAGWFVVHGVAHVFSDLKPGVPKLAVWRAARKLMGLLPRSAICVTTGSGLFLDRLGWVYLGDCDEGEVYAWHS